MMLGAACHICAAAPGGPRYDAAMSKDERRSVQNGIWMCNIHAKSIDTHDPKFTVQLLRDWKRLAEEYSHRRALYNEDVQPVIVSEGEIGERLNAAAAADLEVFRRSDKWPSSDVPLTVHMKQLDQPVHTTALARALSQLGDLILIAPPGMGKTSTLLQVAGGLVAHGETPIFVPLADWATENKPLLNSILDRSTFRGKVSEDDFRTRAQKAGVYLLLDGWNELDGTARRRATAELQRLQADLPELGLLVSTRKQSLDVPFEGEAVELQPLDEVQQIEIARTLRGEKGVSILDQAWRTSGVRDLVTIPLYLTALLSLPDGHAFPKTKEEILRLFVQTHEQMPDHAEPLLHVIKGLQTEFLVALAVTGIEAATTSIPEAKARRSIGQQSELLVKDGQLTINLQPTDVLDCLVSHHILVRTGNPPGYSFQHQQFQEWYASNHVERVMLDSVHDVKALGTLRAEILNVRTWEEPILFAVERLARGNQHQQEACCAAILAAFEIDPILAAEMIYRATDPVWAQISDTIQRLIRRWHTPGRPDRALRFMITSGRPEFRDLVWPLITDENDQISYAALRMARRFRPSVLGSNAVKDILALLPSVRAIVVSEIAYNGGIDGLDLTALIAKSDPNPEVKAKLVVAMTFRRAERHILDVLSTADDDTVDLAYQQGCRDEFNDTELNHRFAAARARAERETSAFDRLHAIVYDRNSVDHGAELTEIVATIEPQNEQKSVFELIHAACRQYTQEVAQGLLKRMLAGRELFFGADNILATAGIVVEDDVLVGIAVSTTERRDNLADAAASVLGPVSVGKLIDAMLAVFAEINTIGKYDENLSNRYHGLRARIAHTPGSSLIVAVQERAANASNDTVRELAELLSRPEQERERARPFPPDACFAVAQMCESWSERLRASDDKDPAARRQLAELAKLIGHFPCVELLPLLRSLLDDELRRYRAFRQQAEAEGWRGKAADNARWHHTNYYQHAFSAFKSPMTVEIMISYLADEYFGETAAIVLKEQWLLANEPKKDRLLWREHDFSGVQEKRNERARCPTLTCAEAEAIFATIESLITSSATDSNIKHAVTLAIHAVRLPHGERPDTIAKLLAYAPRTPRARLILNLILSGETIPFSLVQSGIDDVIQEAQKSPWILHEGWHLKSWLVMLPFTDHPAQLAGAIAKMPSNQRDPHFLRDILNVCASVQTPEIEEALFTLGDTDASFYGSYEWSKAVLRLHTLTSARRYLDLVMADVIRTRDAWLDASEIAGLLRAHAELRDYVYGLLKDSSTPKVDLLARAVTELRDHDGLLLVVELENKLQRPLISWRIIEAAVTANVPSERWRGAFEVVPVAATQLRQQLLKRTTDGGANDFATRMLRAIDQIRDESGAPNDENRHPDLGSGKQWPILAADPYVEIPD